MATVEVEARARTLDCNVAAVDRVEAVRIELALQVQWTRLAQIKRWRQQGMVPQPAAD